MKTQYILQSSPLVYTPGLLEWAQNCYHFAEDRPQLRELFTAGYGLPDAVADALLSAKIPYRVLDDAVIFTVEAAP